MRIEERQAEVDTFLEWHFSPEKKAVGKEKNGATDHDLTDDALIEKAKRAKNGPKFSRLFSGQWEGEYASQSEADLALCCHLAFWTAKDAARVDTLFRRSGLYREKWDEKHFGSGSTYGQKTIETALNGAGNTYGGKERSGKANTPANEWMRQLLCTVDKSGKVKLKAVVANAILILRHEDVWQGVLAFDDFAQRIAVRQRPPYLDPALSFEPRDWRDEDDIQTAAWFQTEYGLFVNPEIARQAALAVARDHPFHPVREYLKGLSWDGVSRLDSMLRTHFGVRESPYTTAVSACWVLSAVARVFDPGCKADQVLILEGRQGIKKSTGLRTLGGRWFTDEIDAIGSKDAATQLQGVWIVELPELDAMSRSEVSRTKAFMSKSFDRFRPPYGKHAIRFERQCVFAGTVNHSDYLRDETGNRRFWPVKCSPVTENGEIDVEGLRRDRDQLWAEAVARYRKGESWWFESALLNTLATAEQDARYSTDAWEPAITKFVRGKDWTTVGEVLMSLGVETPKQGQSEQNRVARCLKRLQWTRRQRTIEEVPGVWGYVPPTPVGDTSPVRDDESGEQKRTNASASSPPTPLSPLSSKNREKEERRVGGEVEERRNVGRVESYWWSGSTGETGVAALNKNCVTCGVEVGPDALFCPPCWSARHARPRSSDASDSCGACGEADFWLNRSGDPVCRRCHPPAPGVEETPQ